MNHQNLFSKQSVKITFIFFLFVYSSFAQVARLDSKSALRSAQTDSEYGPTLIICSNESNDYEKSKTQYFGIKWNVLASDKDKQERINTYPIGDLGFKMVRVGGTAPATPDSNHQPLPHYQYLNDAVNAFLSLNYQRIIILEGEYEVNGSIVIDNVNGSRTTSGTGRITIEGEGFGTSITNTTANPIFIVKSNYNIIKNLKISINDNFATSGIKLEQDYAGVRKLENNVFENIYIGHWNFGNVTRTDSKFVGIELKQTQYSNIGYNTFKNISLQSLYTGIKFSTDGKTSSWDHDSNPSTPAIVSLLNNINDNVFENISIKTVNTGINFVADASNPTFYPQADYNTFNGFHMQTATNTNFFVNNVSGLMNYFNDFKAADWGGTNASITGRRIFTITNGATQTTITNSRLSSTEVRASTNDITDNGFNTQLLNNYHSSGTMINKIGIDKIASNTSRADDRCLTEIKGRLKLSGNDASFNNTFAANKVLTSDVNGYATWQTLGSLAWDFNANKNIRLNNFAITFGDNTTNTTALGLRLDVNGNVRIGNAVPVATDGKLQVDGNILANGNLVSKYNGTPQFTAQNGRVFIGNTSAGLFTEANDLDASYKMVVNGKVRVKDEVYIKPAGLTWPDYVFKKEYPLLPLDELESYIKKEKHLPNMPSAATIEKDGIPISEIIVKQQEKIEELTLYVLAMQKEIIALKKATKN